MPGRGPSNGKRSGTLVLIALVVLAIALLSGGAGAESTGWPEACGIASPESATPRAHGAGAVPFPTEGGDLTVFAASSLTDAFEEIGDAIEADNPEVSVTFNFAGSQTLVTQLAEGATADVLATADADSMAMAADARVVIAEPQVFTGNVVVLVVPATNPADITRVADLSRPGVKLVLAGPSVPAGRYAREAMCAVAMTAPPGWLEGVKGNVVSEEEDVRDVLAKVQLGEADAGLVYATDAQSAGEAVIAISLPDGASPMAHYPIAAATDGDEALAAAFIGYVRSDEGMSILRAHGFLEP